jgi:hypothetical protein
MWALAGTSALTAQDGPERAALDSLLAEIGRVESSGAIPTETRCAAYSGPHRLLCQGFVATLRAEASGTADDANRADFLIRQVVETRPQWALGWYGLGIARLQQARAGVRAKEGPLQTLGVSLEAGAGHAFVRALEVEPTLSMAAEALALAPIPREGASQIRNRVATLRRARGMLGPLELMGMAQVERLAGSRDTAVTLLEDALLTRGVDDGVVRLELARELHVVGRSQDGRMVLFAGAGFDSEAAKAAYRRELEWVAEPHELAAWDSTVAAERAGWLQRFWAARDVAGGWTEGERLEEHYRRVEHAWANFTLVLPPSGRHKIRTRTGGIDTFVDDLMVREATSAAAIDAEFAPAREDADPQQEAALAFATARTTVALESMRLAGLDGPFRPFRSTQAVLDDRGVVHIRHGAPSRMATSVGGEALAAWVYDRDDGRLVLLFREENFDGQVGASTLVPTLLDVPARFRDQFCHLEPSLCTMTNTVSASDNRLAMGAVGTTLRDRGARNMGALTDGGRIGPGSVNQAVEVGVENIVRATTTDAHPRTFTAKVTPAVQLYGLDRGQGDGPRAVAAFAIPGDQLVYTQPAAAGGRSVYSIRFRLSAVDEAGQRRDLDTLRHFAVAAPLAKGQALQGVLEMQLPGGRQIMSLALTQDDGRGAVASLGAIPVPRGGARLGISSLVLGREGSGVAWRSSTMTVPLNPINAFTRGSEATLYFQLHGLQAGTQYQTRLEFLDAAKPEARPALSLQFAETAEGPRLEVLRTIGLKNLDAGRYRLRVTITGGGSTVTETAWLTVSK